MRKHGLLKHFHLLNGWVKHSNASIGQTRVTRVGHCQLKSSSEDLPASFKQRIMNPHVAATTSMPSTEAASNLSSLFFRFESPYRAPITVRQVEQKRDEILAVQKG